MCVWAYLVCRLSFVWGSPFSFGRGIWSVREKLSADPDNSIKVFIRTTLPAHIDSAKHKLSFSDTTTDMNQSEAAAKLLPRQMGDSPMLSATVVCVECKEGVSSSDNIFEQAQLGLSYVWVSCSSRYNWTDFHFPFLTTLAPHWRLFTFPDQTIELDDYTLEAESN